MDQKDHQSANLLINESSPYLLQHAYNPVDWRPWNQESLEEAKKTNKALLISIGYSACHWCHVMERESFEDPEIAQIMNEHFICIKVDREERPDIDHLYMDAVQLMNGNGGWPLNCFALPNGKPFYGGTYFPKEQWKGLLLQLSELYANENEKVVEYANKLSNGIRQNELIEKVESPSKFSDTILDAAVGKWKKNFDLVHGGNNSAPKFPMPNNYEFLLHYYYHSEDPEIKTHLELSLRKMAFGGIYDQIGGGFARYSTDTEWKVPHFEKMLYDNAQLISLYSKAYKAFQDPLYKDVIEESIAFLNREMLDESGAYYSALDADSEGEEGKFYIWSLAELQEVLSKEDYELAKVYFNFNEAGEWEGSYIPLRNKSDHMIESELGLSKKELSSKIAMIKSDLYERRNKRVRPGLDDKSLSSWNSLTIIALLDAYEALGDETHLKSALKTAEFIKKSQLKSNNELFHSYKNGKSTINGFLEDYAFTIEAFIKLYENTFDPTWLVQSEKLLQICLDQFYDSQSSYFYFNSINDPELISRKIEKDDNVIPASNSSLCKGLYKLGSLMANEEYLKISDQMLANSLSRMTTFLPYSSNWADQLLIRSNPFREVAIVGKDASKKRIELIKQYLPNSIFLGEEEELNSLELLEGKWVDGVSYIYVCENKSCKRPLEDVQSTIQELRN